MSRFSLEQIPDGAGVYALYEHEHPVFVGFGASVRERVEHHLVGPAQPGGMRAARLDPGRVTKVCWWMGPEFDDEARREAAWEIAIQVVSPALRPRFSLSDAAQAAFADGKYVRRMEKRFRGTPDGIFIPQSLDSLARTILELEEKVAALEARLAGGHGQG